MRMIVLLALCSASLWAGEHRIRPEVARLLPPDAITVASIDVASLRDLPLAERLGLDIWADVERLIPAGLFDPRRDLDRVTVAGDAGHSGVSLLIVEGRFNDRLADLLLPAGERHGHTLYQSGSRTLGFADQGTLVVGARERVEAAFDRWRLDARLSRLAEIAASQDGADAWISTLDAESAIGQRLESVPGGGGPLRALMKSMEGVSLRGSALPGALSLELTFLCGSGDDAQALADTAATLAAFGAMASRQDRPEMADVLSALTVSRTESEATVSVEVTDAQLLRMGRGFLSGAYSFAP